jgi:hypothetical protein
LEDRNYHSAQIQGEHTILSIGSVRTLYASAAS